MYHDDDDDNKRRSNAKTYTISVKSRNSKREKNCFFSGGIIRQERKSKIMDAHVSRSGFLFLPPSPPPLVFSLFIYIILRHQTQTKYRRIAFVLFEIHFGRRSKKRWRRTNARARNTNVFANTENETKWISRNKWSVLKAAHDLRDITAKELGTTTRNRPSGRPTISNATITINYRHRVRARHNDDVSKTHFEWDDDDDQNEDCGVLWFAENQKIEMKKWLVAHENNCETTEEEKTRTERRE